MHNIFDQPWFLLITAIVVLFIMLMIRRIVPGKRHWWQIALPIFIVLAAFGLDRLVQTDLEKINAVINTLAQAVEDENCDAIAGIISENYSDSYHSSKDYLVAHCRAKLSGPLVEKNIMRVVAVEISEPTATAIFTLRILFDKRSYVYEFRPLMLMKIKLNLQKQADKHWLITRAEIIEIDRQPAKWQYLQ